MSDDQFVFKWPLTHLYAYMHTYIYTHTETCINTNGDLVFEQDQLD